jgi:flagellar motor switch protein FliM
VSDVPKELQAVLGRLQPARVAARDFVRPQRLGSEQLAELALRLENLLPQLEKRLRATTGVELSVTPGGLEEHDAGALFTGASEPLCVLRFRAGKDPSWLRWDAAAAVGLVEAILGARGVGAGAARALTATESKIAAQFLGEVLRAVAGVLGIAVAEPALVQAASELGTWREGGEDAQAHRLLVRIALAHGEQRSDLCLYFPGVRAPEAAAGAGLPAKLPTHLEEVEVELSARLPGCEISLDQLLALEEGDVIPLDARTGDPTRLCVDGLALAEGRLGSHRGRLAVRIERLKVQSEA